MQQNYIQDSFLQYAVCSNPDCLMGLSPFSTTEYTRCPVCDEPAILPYSLSPILSKNQNTKNIFERYFPETVTELFQNMLDKAEDIGNTPLSKNKKISEWAGIKNIFLKEEGNNPSGSFKDRGSFMAIGLLQAYTKRNNFDQDFIFGTVSTGNMAISTAFFANRMNLNSFIVISNKTPQKKIDAIQKAAGKNGTTIFIVDGEYAKIHEIVYRTCSNLRKHYISIFPELTDDVFRISGYATLFAEIIQQLLHTDSFPDIIILPVASGAFFRAALWAVESLFAKGFIKKIPRLVLVQEIGGDPIIHALDKNLKKIERIAISPTTIASGIAVSDSRSGNPILRVLREGYHSGIGIESKNIQEAKILLESQNYFPEEASCASLAAAKKLIEKGKISKNDTVVCVLTGADISKRNLGNIKEESTTSYCNLKQLEELLIKTYARGIKTKNRMEFDYFC